MPKRFNWKKWIEKIEQAAKRNEPLRIKIPKREWKRLRKENIVSLKGQLTEKTAERLTLVEDPDNKQCFLQVVRFGRCCPH